eukprot:10924406-Alexandrium_andersonii.AAC.1
MLRINTAGVGGSLFSLRATEQQTTLHSGIPNMQVAVHKHCQPSHHTAQGLSLIHISEPTRLALI